MNKNKYRILALLLCVTMIVSSFSGIPVNAAMAVTSSTETDGTDTAYAPKSLTLTQADAVAFQAEYFPAYVIKFGYYNESEDEWYEYNQSMGTSFKASELLSKLGVTFSNVTSATSDMPTVITVTGSGNDTCIEGTGDGNATLTVSYDGSSTARIDVTVATATGTCGENLTWAVIGSDMDYTLSISGSGAMDDYESSCEDGQWKSCAPWSTIDVAIKSIVIDEDVTRIGDGAFCGLQLAGELTIPDNVSSIGSNAFAGGSGLTGNLTIPSGVTSIGSKAFYCCSGLTGNLTIPSGVISIDTGTFYGCSGLKGNLTIPSGVTSIGSYAFFDCNGLSGELSIPSGVTSIGSTAFSGCSGLAGNLTIPSGMTRIEDSVFRGCSGLTGNLTIPSGVTSIGSSAFAYCSGLNGNLTIPDSVESLEYDAFSGCSKLQGQVKIPANATKIEGSTFAGCSSLTGNLTIPAGVTEIGSNAFQNCTGLTGTLEIPNGVTVIKYNAFNGCTGFDKAIIPKSVTEIGEGYNPYYGSFMGWKAGSYIYNLSSVSMTSGKHYSGATLGAVYTVTTHVDGSTTAITVLGDNKPTTAIADPTKVDYEFEGWYTDAAFTTKWDSTKAITKNMDLYAKFEKILASGNCGAEGDGSNLNYKITTTDNTNYTLTISGSGAMANYAEFASIPWYADYRNILTSLVLAEGMTSIGDSAFCGCNQLKGSLIIPSGVTRIGKDAFRNCFRLTGSLTIPSGVTSIGLCAFYNCSGLTGNLTIPSGVTSIGISAFEWCTGLTGELIMPDSVISIETSAFQFCTGLTKIIIPKSVTIIGDNAFNISNILTKIYNLSNLILTEGNHYHSSDNLGTVYTVTTHVDGAETSIRVLGDGEATVTIPSVDHVGYAFIGWYTDSVFSADKRWNGNNMTVSENLDLYAKQQKILTVSDISKISNIGKMTYNGSANIPVTLTLTGYDPSGEGTPVTETATATATVSSEKAGTYTGYTLSNIAFVRGTNSNYILAGVTDGSIAINSEDADAFGITIEKKELTITAENVTVSVGDTMPELTNSSLTYSGFIEGENKSVLGGSPDVTFSQNHTNSELSDGTVTPEGYTTDNYALTYVPGKFVVTAKTFGSTPYTVSGINNGKTGADIWYTGDITLTPDNIVGGNFKYISISSDGGNTYSDWSTQAVIPAMDGTAALDTKNGSVIVKLATAAEGETGTERAVVTLQDAFTYQLDTAAPTGRIIIESGIFKDFLDTITFGLLFNKDISVSIVAESSPADLSGTTTYLYKDTTASTKAKTYEELDALSETADVKTGWKQTGSFSVTTDEQFTVYGKIVDGAGHVTYLNSKGVIVDQTAPVISALAMSGITDVMAEAQLTADEAGTYYYVVLGSNDTAPASGEEIAQTTASVSKAVGKNVRADISIKGLTASTAYIIYFTVKDTAGNYSDILQVYITTEKTMVTIAEAPTITGTYGQQVSDMTITGGVAKVGETIIPGSWSLASHYTNIPSVGTQTACSVTFIPADMDTYEKATADVIPTVTARSLTADEVTVPEISGTYTYTGETITPDITVSDTGAAITADDYDITYRNNINAGENAAEVTVTGKGNYTGTVTRAFSIAKVDTAITIAPGSESYAKNFGDAAFSLTGITKIGEGTLTYASSRPSVATVNAKGMVTIKGAGTTEITVGLQAMDNYNTATSKTITVTVGKAAALTIADITKSYIDTAGMDGESIDLSTLLPKDRKDTTYQIDSIKDTKIILNDAITVSSEGILTYSTFSGNIGDTAVINVMASMENYEDTMLKVVVKLTDKTVVDITGVTIADKIYDGETAAVKGSVSFKETETAKSVNIDGLTYTYTSTDGKNYASSTPPKDAGSYQLVISVPDSNKTYQGSTEPLTFTIAKKIVTVKVLNKEIQTGQTIPGFTNPVKGTDYSVSALVGSDKLNGTVTLQYADSVDNSKAGSTAIIIGGVTAGDNYSLRLVNGTLTIKQAESSNTENNNTESNSNVAEATGTNQTVTGTVQRETVQQTENISQMEENKPYLAGNEEKSGWEAVMTEIKDSSDKAATNPVTLTVEMDGATILPANVITELRGKNVNLMLDMGDGIIWTINGMDVEDTQLLNIDLGVTRNTNVIPENVIDGIRGENSSIQIELAHNGVFGFTATLSIAVDSADAGSYANLFYYNEETGELEYMESAQVSEDGTATLTFVHASAYSIVLSSEAMADSSKTISTVAQATDKISGNMMVIWIILGVIVVGIIACATVYMRNKKDKIKEDKE